MIFRIANNIGREDRGEPALDALFGHAAASLKTREDGQFYVGKWAESNDLECLLWVNSRSQRRRSESLLLGDKRT